MTLASALIHSNDILSDELDHTIIQMSGNIATIPKVSDTSISFIFEPDNIELPERIALKIYKNKKNQLDNIKIKLNTRLKVIAKIQQPRGYTNPGTFDYEKWLFSKRIGARGYIRDYSILSQAKDSNNFGFSSLRQILADKLYEYRDTRLRIKFNCIAWSGILKRII